MRRTALLMARHDDRELNQLLSRGRLSGAEYDEIEKRVLERVAPAPRRSLWPVLAPGFALAATFALFFVLRPAPEAVSKRAAAFTTKGDTSSRDGVVSVGCGGGRALACRLGDTLMFSVSARSTDGYLVAYAERVDDPAAQRIWYFPHAGSTSPRIAASESTSVLSEGVRLGAPHTRGRYRLTARITQAPLTRSQLGGLVKDDEQIITFDIE